jgi:hypothetical protein
MVKGRKGGRGTILIGQEFNCVFLLFFASIFSAIAAMAIAISAGDIAM